MNDLAVARDQVRYEQKAYWRNPMAAIFTFMFPIIFLVVVGTSAGSARVEGTTLRYDQYTVVAMLTFGLIAACYTNLAMAICNRRELGVLKRMRGTPISMGSYIGGIIGSVLINVAILAVVVVGIGMGFYHLHFPYHLAAALVILLVGIVTFGAIGMAVTIIVPNADAAPAVINGLYFPVVFVSGVVLPDLQYVGPGPHRRRVPDPPNDHRPGVRLRGRPRIRSAVGGPGGDAGLGGRGPGPHRPPVPVGAPASMTGQRSPASGAPAAECRQR